MAAHGDRPSLPRGIEQLPSGLYRGAFYRDGIRHRTATYKRSKDAQDALADLRSRVTRGEVVDTRRSPTVAAWWATWSPTRPVRPITAAKDADRYRLHIEPHLGQVRLAALTPAVVEAWMGKLAAAGTPAATIAKARTLLSTMLGPRGAMRHHLVRANPVTAIPAPAHQKAAWRLLETDELDAVLAEVGPEWAYVVLLAAYTGLRWGEMCALRAEHYDPGKATLTVRLSTPEHAGRLYPGPTKGYRERTLPVHPRLAAALDALDRKPTDLLVQAERGGRLRHSNFRARIWIPACTRAKIGKVRWHDLRHTCASWLLEHGADLATVQEVMGHASVATTALYVHANAKRRRAAVEALPG